MITPLDNINHVVDQAPTEMLFTLSPGTPVQRQPVIVEVQVRALLPGTGIPDFDRHAALIAKAGIYDLQIHHEQILVPVVIRQWGADKISGLTGDGAAAQERLMKRLATSEKVAKRFAERRDAALANA